MAGQNLLDVKDAFFVVDSGNLEQQKTRLYGYVITDGMLVENESALQGRELTGEGAYVYMERRDGQIHICQDFLGSYGLYLFRDGDYFALSNSFILLVDHIKKDHRITFNRQFANYFIPSEMCSAAFSETMIREITLLDRNAQISIDIAAKTLDIRYHDYQENTVSLSSEEGIRILDTWFHKWTTLIRNLSSLGEDLQIALTGGFDSRMTFNLLLGAGIDLNRVFVHSIHDDIHTHPEDYVIASQIAEYYGFSLNNTDLLCPRTVNYTVDDSLNMSFYLKLGFHKQMYHQYCRFEKPRHYFGGAGGEAVRSYWNFTEEAYLSKAMNRLKPCPAEVQQELADSLQRVMNTSFEQLREKFRKLGRPLSRDDTLCFLYRETRCRVHFGKDFIEKYYGGIVKYSPLLDPQLHQLTRSDDQCKDRDLLMALMFARYNPKLLEFPFDSGRFIAPETVAYAKAISARFPIAPNPPQSAPERIPGRAWPVGENPVIGEADVDAAVEHIFRSDRVKSTFELLYGEKMYRYVSNLIVNNTYYVWQDACSVIGISKILQDVLDNERRFSPTVADTFRSETLARPLTRREEQSLRSHGYLENYITARIDIQNIADPSNDLVLLTNTDSNSKAAKPQWMAKNGHGYTIESQKGEIELVFRCVGAGSVNIAVRSRDVRNPDKQRIPFWLDLHAVQLNGETCIDQVQPIWHDAPLRLRRDVADGDEIRLFLKWNPHDERKYRLPVPPVPKEAPKPEAPAAKEVSEPPKTLMQKIAGLFR